MTKRTNTAPKKQTLGIGTGRPGPGRKAGIPNKATANAREAISKFVDGNAHRLTEWLDQIALESPKQAFDSFMAVVEYHVPKLARVEHAGEIKHAVVIQASSTDEAL